MDPYFETSHKVQTLGQFEIRKVKGGAWDDCYIVVRTADQDVISRHGGKGAAFAKMFDLDCGRVTANTKADRIAQIANVPTDHLIRYVAKLDPYTDWKTVTDIKAALASR
jgi:hypothetical protein